MPHRTRQCATQDLSVNRAHCCNRLHSIGMPLVGDVSLSPTLIFIAPQSHKRHAIDLHERGRAACVHEVFERLPDKDCP